MKINDNHTADNNNNLRQNIRIFLDENKTLQSKIFNIAILLLNLMFCALFVLETFEVSNIFKKFLFIMDIILVSLFLIEYLARFYASENKIKYIFNIYSLIDIISIIPTFLLIFNIFGFSIDVWFMKLVRIFKVFRIFRFFRYTSDPNFFFGSITFHLLKVMRLILTIIIIFFVSSGIFFYAENEMNPEINNFGDAFYFSVVALTTVGFGDITPVTKAGRTITTLMILSGIILIPWQGSQVIKEWVFISSKKRVTCKKCGLRFHDQDASHCKHCGNVIYQETDGE